MYKMGRGCFSGHCIIVYGYKKLLLCTIRLMLLRVMGGGRCRVVCGAADERASDPRVGTSRKCGRRCFRKRRPASVWCPSVVIVGTSRRARQSAPTASHARHEHRGGSSQRPSRRGSALCLGSMGFSTAKGTCDARTVSRGLRNDLLRANRVSARANAHAVTTHRRPQNLALEALWHGEAGVCDYHLALRTEPPPLPSCFACLTTGDILFELCIGDGRLHP
jgi:hypothetical protein